MKKTLLSLALLGTMAGAATASQVTMYGLLDAGLGFTSIAADHNAKIDHLSDSTVTLDSGNNAASRFGIKGTENLANGVVVGFKLENGFDADDGELGNNGRLFGREAVLFVETSYGTVSMGRMGLLASDNGSTGLLADVSPMGSGWADMIGNQNLVFASNAGRADNAIAYSSPKFNGLQMHAQYSFKLDNKKDKGHEGHSDANRYGALGVTYQAGAVGAVAVVDYLEKGDVAHQRHGKDTVTFTLGANYDCGFAKTHVGAQYFQDADWVGGSSEYDAFGWNLAKADDNSARDLEGFGLVAGVSMPALNGTLYGMMGYMEAESDRTNKEMHRWTVGGGYEYPISARTAVYTGAGYMQDAVDNTDPAVAQVVMGLKHSF